MTAHRVATLAAVLIVACVSGAAAQFSGFPQQNNPCTAFVPMQKDAEQALTDLKAANERKAPREEFCQIFQRLALSTGKMAKFLEQNKTQCGVPAEAVQRSKADHSKSLTFRKQACSAAPAAAAPGLSDVLSAPILPDSTTTKPNMGTFNTLTGNPLER